MSSKKVIVTNRSALRAKYKAKGWKRIQEALDALIAADAARDVQTEVVFLDDKAGMKRRGVAAVTNPLDAKQNKQAIDAVARDELPAYLMILGAPDVVAMQSMLNPTGDEDPDVPSDLPYACTAPYSRDIVKFLAPTRVVGRLPGIMGDSDPGYLVSLIDRATRWSTQHPSRYRKPFGVSAYAWQGSTNKSLRKVFGSAEFELSPEGGPKWKKSLLGRMSHFINLHGAMSSPAFYGDPDFPEAHRADGLAGYIREGTIVAAECCYGAELYVPGEYGTSICNVYLAEGAYAFLGSTTIAYGPADDNGAADFICQDFFRHVFDGASTGRALLQARQEFVRKSAPIDPIDLKTMAQFYLLGDPSIHPVKPATRRGTTAKGGLAPGQDPKSRAQRRDQLQKTATIIEATKATVRSKADGTPSADMEQALARLCAERGIEPAGKATSYSIQPAARPDLLRGNMAKTYAAGGSTYHLVAGQKKGAGVAQRTSAERAREQLAGGPVSASLIPRARGRKARGPAQVRIHDRVVLVVRESQGEIVDMYEYMAR
jgi:Peptidase family C25